MKNFKAQISRPKLRYQLTLQAMVWPALACMIVFTYFPFYGLVVAFKNYSVMDSMQTSTWVGMQNFLTAFKDQFFWNAVFNTLGISFLKLLIGFPLPIIIAVLIWNMRGMFKNAVGIISYLPHFLSWVVLGGMMTSWLATTGILSKFLVWIGVLSAPSNFLINAGQYWWLAVLSDVWKETGWNTIIYTAALTGIDPTYYEAARIDGAGKLRQFWYITLPMIRRIIALNFILTIGGLLNSNLDQTMVLINPLNRSKAEVINSYVYTVGLQQGDFGYSTAVGLFISVISLILVLVTNVVTKRLNDNSTIF